jgi:hypothetical protein
MFTGDRYSEPGLAGMSSQYLDLGTAPFADHDRAIPTSTEGWVLCPVNQCFTFLQVDRVQFWAHMKSHLPLLATTSLGEYFCGAISCACKTPLRGSCPKGHGHQSHAKDITQHMWDHHMVGTLFGSPQSSDPPKRHVRTSCGRAKYARIARTPRKDLCVATNTRAIGEDASLWCPQLRKSALFVVLLTQSDIRVSVSCSTYLPVCLFVCLFVFQIRQ